MAQIKANGITIEYESFGSASGEAVLLIMGLGSQLIHWPIELCHELVERGYRVVRYDNRDVGLSTKFDTAFPPSKLAIFGPMMVGLRPAAPYSLDDMARDAVGLLDALGIKQAHIAGASMGGMIAQLIAADHPGRVLSLTSIMSTTSNPALPSATPKAAAALMSRPAPAGNLEAIAARSLAIAKTIGSPGFPTEERVIRKRAKEAARRSYCPAGVARQMAASFASGDRRKKLKKIKAPTVVLHGADDPLIPVAAGKDTAAHIPGAELRIIPGMGHDFPVALVKTFADAITAAASRAGNKRDDQDRPVVRRNLRMPPVSKRTMR
jgi:pimeloyl-ACP methyl ester carboxylesterase